MTTTSKILLVDDTRLFIELEKSFLKLSPVHVLTASSAEEALDVAATERPDLIFLDIHMPGIGGIACCKLLKNDPSLKSIPVVMVSASGKEEDLDLCRSAGCDDYVTKPVERKIFLEKARRFLNTVDRREPRINFRAEVSCRLKDQFMTVHSVDLSSGGVYLQCEMDVVEKEMMALSFVLATSDEPAVVAKGQIAWVNGTGLRKKPSLPPGFGVEFIDMAESSRSAIRSFLDSRP
ncbi:MAG: response regulator [Geobacteraceae bacterium]|nr:response regulator [Geobacteraceae bacterium]